MSLVSELLGQLRGREASKALSCVMDVYLKTKVFLKTQGIRCRNVPYAFLSLISNDGSKSLLYRLDFKGRIALQPLAI